MAHSPIVIQINLNVHDIYSITIMNRIKHLKFINITKLKITSSSPLEFSK